MVRSRGLNFAPAGRNRRACVAANARLKVGRSPRPSKRGESVFRQRWIGLTTWCVLEFEPDAILRHVASWGDRIPHGGITNPRRGMSSAPRAAAAKFRQPWRIESTKEQKSPALSLGRLSCRHWRRGMHRLGLRRPRLSGELDRDSFRDRRTQIARGAAVAPIVHVQLVG